MSTIRIEYDYALSKAKTMEINAEKVNTLLNNLAGEVEANINPSTWSGSSAESFLKAWKASADEFSRFIEYMKSVQSKVYTAGTESKEFDEKYNK